jgi:hypothetical protein
MAPVVVDGVVLRIRPGIKQVINRFRGEEYDRANRAYDQDCQQHDAAFAALKFSLVKEVQSVI